MTRAPHPHPQPPSLLFSKTGIILHIFFPSPKIGRRREQIIWSSCWFCYLTKIFFFFYSHSVSGFPSHLHNLLLPFSSDAPFCKSHPLENPENVSASASLKLSTQLKGLLLRRSEPPTQGFLPLAMRTFSLDHWLVSVSFGTSHPR